MLITGVSVSLITVTFSWLVIVIHLFIKKKGLESCVTFVAGAFGIGLFGWLLIGNCCVIKNYYRPVVAQVFVTDNHTSIYAINGQYAFTYTNSPDAHPSSGTVTIYQKGYLDTYGDTNWNNEYTWNN